MWSGWYDRRTPRPELLRRRAMVPMHAREGRVGLWGAGQWDLRTLRQMKLVWNVGEDLDHLLRRR